MHHLHHYRGCTDTKDHFRNLSDLGSSLFFSVTIQTENVSRLLNDSEQNLSAETHLDLTTKVIYWV